MVPCPLLPVPVGCSDFLNQILETVLFPQLSTLFLVSFPLNLICCFILFPISLFLSFSLPLPNSSSVLVFFSSFNLLDFMLPKAVWYTNNKLLPLFQCSRLTFVHFSPLIIITIITIIIIQCWLVLISILLCIVFVYYYPLLLIMINWMVFLFGFVPLHWLMTSTLGLWTCQLVSVSLLPHLSSKPIEFDGTPSRQLIKAEKLQEKNCPKLPQCVTVHSSRHGSTVWILAAFGLQLAPHEEAGDGFVPILLHQWERHLHCNCGSWLQSNKPLVMIGR